MASNSDDNDGKNGRDDDPANPAPDAPSPVAGVDWQTFKNFLTRALNGDDSVPSVLLQRVNQALQGGERNLEQRGRHWWHEFFLRQAIDEHLKAIDGLIDRYQKMAEWHHEQAEKARARMQEATDKLGEIDEFMEGADDILRNKNAGGKFDREKAMRLLRSRGVAVNGDESEEDLLRKIAMERIRAREDRVKWADEYDRSKADADLNDELEQENLRKAKELVEKRDAIRTGGYSAEEEEQRLRRVSEEYEADVRHRATKMEQRRLDAEQAKAADVAAQKDWGRSQTATQESDFEALAGSITGKFAEAAANKPKDIPPDFAPPNKPGPLGPVTSA